MTLDSPRRGRPPMSSPDAVAEIAFELLLRDGYETTTVQAIMAASGISRTTFFRYFGSKAGIVWGEFDRAVDRLRQALAGSADASAMAAVLSAVVESTQLSREASPEGFLDRFRVIDDDPSLRGEAAAHWRRWAAEISSFIEERTGIPAVDVIPAAIGGAVQAAYVSVLRQWSKGSNSVDLDALRQALVPITDAFQRLLDERAIQ